MIAKKILPYGLTPSSYSSRSDSQVMLLYAFMTQATVLKMNYRVVGMRMKYRSPLAESSGWEIEGVSGIDGRFTTI